MSAEALRLHLNRFNLAMAGRRPQLVERLSQHLGAVSDGSESESEEDAPPTSRSQGPSASRSRVSATSGPSASRSRVSATSGPSASSRAPGPSGSSRALTSGSGRHHVARKRARSATPTPTPTARTSRTRTMTRRRARPSTPPPCPAVSVPPATRRRQRRGTPLPPPDPPTTRRRQERARSSSPRGRRSTRRGRERARSPTPDVHEGAHSGARDRHLRARSDGTPAHARSSPEDSWSSSSSHYSSSSSSSRSPSSDGSRHCHHHRHHHRSKRTKRMPEWGSRAAVSCAPPLPYKLQRKIARGEYIDFNNLLPSARAPPFAAAKSHKKGKASRRRIVDQGTWLEAWNRFLCARLAHDPSVALELAKYQTTMCMLFTQYAPVACIEYDDLFRQSASQDQSLRWDSLKDDIFLWALTRPTHRNDPTDEGRSFRGHQQRDRSSAFDRLGPPPPFEQHVFRSASGAELCKRFNLGKCNKDKDTCRFAHMCWIPGCNGTHAGKDCPKRTQ